MKDNTPSSGRRDFFKLTGGALGIAAISYFFGLTDRAKPVPPSDELPDYEDGEIGVPVFRGPYLQKDTQLASFLYHADIVRLTALCDQTLNTVESSPFKYIPLVPNVLLVYADMLVSSLDERDSQIGFIPETEVSFWVLTIAMQKTSDGHTPHHLAWYLPYLLVDEGNSIATGREVYGFNKQAAEFEKPQKIRSPQFNADVLGFKQFAPIAVARKERLLELKPSSAETSQSKWKDWNSAKSEFAGELLKNIRPDLASGIVEFASRAIIDNVPLVFLKQFRHAANPRKVSYKAVVEAHLRIEVFHEGGPFSGPYRLTINHLDSHPFAQKLGLKEEQISTLGAWMKVDFVLEHGVEYQG